MSHISKTSTTTTTISTDSIAVSNEEKGIAELSLPTIKRSVSIEIPMEVKKMMIHHDTSNEMSKCTATLCSPIKFPSGAVVTTSIDVNSNAIPEISDDELLQMALMLEKEEEQQQTNNIGKTK